MGRVETESTQTNDEKSPRDLSQAFLDSLLPHSHRIVPLAAAMLLVTEAILALVVIFSRMSPLQQFVCVVLIVVLPAAVLALAISTVARLSRRPGIASPPAKDNRFPALESAPWTPNPRKLAASNGDELSMAASDLNTVIEQMDETTAKTRKLPFNILVGIDEMQLTYWLVKLKAISQTLAARAETQLEPTGLLGDSAPILEMEKLGRIQENVRPRKQPAAITEAVPALPPPIEPVPATLADARTALKSGTVDSAIRILKGLLQSNSDDAEAAELLGVAYERSGDVDSALEAMRVAVLIDPQRASSHYNYAVLLAKVDRLIDAYRQNDVALRLNPRYSAAVTFQETLHSRIVAQQNSDSRAVVESISSTG